MQEDQSHSFSIVIPCFNAGRTLGACLDGFLSSSLPRDRFELIVVDDGSNDGGPELARARGVTVVDTAGRVGPAGARNRGAAAASMEYLLFVDSDIIAPPDTLKKFAAAISSFPEYTVIQAILAEGDYASIYSRYLHSWFYYFYRLRSNYRTMTMSSGCLTLPRADFFAAGGFNAELRSNEDTELGYRLALLGKKILICTDIEVLHDSEHSLRSFARRNYFVRNFLLVRLTYGLADITSDNPEYRVPVLNLILAAGLIAALASFLVFPWPLATAICTGLLLYQLHLNRRFFSSVSGKFGRGLLPRLYLVLQLDNFVKLAGLARGGWNYFIRRDGRTIRRFARKHGIPI